MPELPEVETIRRDLEKHALNRRVVHFQVHDARLMTTVHERRWNSHVLNHRMTAFERRGKYLLIHLDHGWQIIFHLRMTGQLALNHPKEGAKERLRLEFEDSSTLSFVDQRRFGEVWLLAPGDPWPAKSTLGPDALNELTADDFIALVKKRTTRIQPLLMDQRLLSGIGNIYAQEALFKAFIRPSRPGAKVTRAEALLLFKTIQETLQNAITHRGSTSRNYRDALGQSGSAQTLHAVYRKGGQPCSRCGARLIGTRVGGRGTVYCRHCQR